MIAEVEFNGQRTSSVEIIIAKPKERPAPANVKPQDAFPSGTIFQIPANTVVWLSTNNNRQRLGPGSKHQATVSPKGESHQTFVGQVTHYVSNLLNFYKASGPTPKYQGAVEGTIFTVEAVGKDVKFNTTEGRVAIQSKVPLTISEAAKVERKKERELTTTQVTYLSEGDSEQLFNHNSSEQVTYATYAEAIAIYQQQLDQAFDDGVDAGYLVDGYMTLGALYLDNGEPEQAIDPLERAVQLLKEIDPDDPFIAEDYLTLAEAYYYSDDEAGGDENWNIAVDILKEEVPYYEEEYRYFLEEEDNDTAWSIGQDLADMYDTLGWAYELVEDYDQAEEYYQRLDELEAELETL
jgi:tetratricopeptide (TPR) repeat protein